MACRVETTPARLSLLRQLAEASDGTLSAFTLPTAGERDAYGFDSALHLGPFDLSAEYLNERVRGREVLNVTPTFDGFDAEGYYVQGAYFIIPKKLQVVGRWESFNPAQEANERYRLSHRRPELLHPRR